MQVIPVIDLLGGQVVRGIAGRRDEYRPIHSQISKDPLPTTIAQAFVERFGFKRAYVADLDAIVHGNLQVDAWREIAAAGMTLWLDAGVGDAAAAQRITTALDRAQISYRMIVGLETLESLAALAGIMKVADRPIVSIDLKAGLPLTRIDEFRGTSPLAIGRTLHEHFGIDHLLVLDLTDVGVASGTSTLEHCRQISRALRVELTAGGGVRNLNDLQSLAAAGCENVLVASALHDGRLSPADIQQASSYQAGQRLPAR